VKHVERALFPGYLFCQIQPDTVGKVISSPGVIRIVGDGRQPIPVEPHEIDAIRRIVSAGIGAEPYKQLAAGQRIRLTGGPLNGVVGIVVRTATRNRFVVSISLLQRAVAVEIDASWISVVPTVPSELDAVHGAQRGRCYHGLQ
jgi:transcription antitermination factor NusG